MDPQTSLPQKNNSHLRLVLLSVLILFALLVFFLFERSKSVNTTSQQNSTVAPTITQDSSTVGAFSMLLVGGAESLVVNKPFEVDVVVDSAGNSIVGYDAVFSIDSTSIDVVKATSLLEDFTVFPSKKSDHYSVTAAQKIGSGESRVFDKTPVLRLTLQPKKTGPARIILLQSLGLEKTQMVNSETQILNPSVGEITLEIK